MTARYLYVMGSDSGAGKSTVCRSVLALLLEAGLAPQKLGYIKPVTQCTAKQPVASFCEHTGIAFLDIGSLVFEKGFSKAFIDGLTKPSDALRADVLATIRQLSEDKAVVIIDGVGGPAVGSVVGVSNVDVALALPGKVLFVGRPGIGAAIDNTVLCVSFMQAKGLTNIGVLYNKIPLSALAEVKRYVTQRLPELLPDVSLLGFIADDPGYEHLSADHSGATIARWFGAYVNEKALIHDWLELPILSSRYG